MANIFMCICSDRTLPNWQNLKEEEHAPSQMPEISEEDMRVLNSKESSILTSNLSSTDCLIPQQEIITDIIQLRTLGNLGESLVSNNYFTSQHFQFFTIIIIWFTYN